MSTSPDPGAASNGETSAKGASNASAASLTARSGYDSAKLRFVGACACIAVGLAVAGSVDRATGGVLVLIGWIAAVATLHRLGRAGSRAA